VEKTFNFIVAIYLSLKIRVGRKQEIYEEGCNQSPTTPDAVAGPFKI